MTEISLTDRLQKLREVERDLRRYERRNGKRYGNRLKWPYGVLDVYWRLRKKLDRLRRVETGAR